jgi:hypothetical protein
MVFGAVCVLSGVSNHDNGWLLGLAILALGVLPVVVPIGVRRLWPRLRRSSAGRPASPVAASREPIPAGLRFAVLRRDGFRCAYCGRGEPEGVKLHIDHIVPVARGGKTELENLVTACATCNIGKSATDLVGTAG